MYGLTLRFMDVTTLYFIRQMVFAGFFCSKTKTLRKVSVLLEASLFLCFLHECTGVFCKLCSFIEKRSRCHSDGSSRSVGKRQEAKKKGWFSLASKNRALSTSICTDMLTLFCSILLTSLFIRYTDTHFWDYWHKVSYHFLLIPIPEFLFKAVACAGRIFSSGV